MNRYKYWIISIQIFLSLINLNSCRKEPKRPTPEEMKETQEKMVKVNRILVEKDQQRIKKFVERAEWDMIQTETGLWYMISDQGSGVEAGSGLIVTFNYEISLLDGTPCYSSDKEGPKSFVIGKGGVESGLEEGILLLREGDKATFIMPPYLAHGLPGDGDKIPARSIIIYKVDILEIANSTIQ